MKSTNPIIIVILAFLAIYVGYSLIAQLIQLAGYNDSMAAAMGPITLGIVALAAALAVLVGALRGGGK